MKENNRVQDRNVSSLESCCHHLSPLLHTYFQEWVRIKTDSTYLEGTEDNLNEFCKTIALGTPALHLSTNSRHGIKIKKTWDSTVIFFPAYNMLRMKRVCSDTYRDGSIFLTEKKKPSKSEHENIKYTT